MAWSFEGGEFIKFCLIKVPSSGTSSTIIFILFFKFSEAIVCVVLLFLKLVSKSSIGSISFVFNLAELNLLSSLPDGNKLSWSFTLIDTLLRIKGVCLVPPRLLLLPSPSLISLDNLNMLLMDSGLIINTSNIISLAM